jgi:SAM-dependent methyltransferase
MLKPLLKKMLQKALDAAGLNVSPALRELEASMHKVESSIHNLDAVAVGMANIEMKLHQLSLRDKPVPRSVLSSSLCKQSDFFSEEFHFWRKRLQTPMLWTWKLWEFYFIAQALYERGLLAPGNRGLGFGVGTEPLSSLFATFDCKIVATDLVASDPRAECWTSTDQHASGPAQLRKEFCPVDKFHDLVTFRHADMTRVPEDLRGFDFLWSSSSLEHLGSLEHGIKFILDAMKCLKPGGLAVHTTSVCLNSEDATVEAHNLAFYRKKDILDLQSRLVAEGHSIAPISFEQGNGVLDHFVDHPPYGTKAHLLFELLGFVATSIGLIITRSA